MGLGNFAVWEDKAYRSFQDVAGALDGIYYQLVQLAGGDDTVGLNTAPGLEIGVAWEKLQAVATEPAVTIRMLGKGGTTKIIQSGAIAQGQRVMCDPANPTKIMALPDGLGGTTAVPGSYRCLGRKPAGATSGAAGDVVEIIDVIEKVGVFGVATLTETSGAIVLACGPGALDQDAEVTLTANGTLSFTGLVAGMHGRLAVTQGGSGSYTLTLPTAAPVVSIVQGASVAATVTLSTTVGKKDLLEWFYDGTNLWVSAFLAFK